MADTVRQRPLLGTFVEIGVDGAGPAADAAVTAAFAEIAAIHDLLSFQSPDSALSAFNRDPMAWHDLAPAFRRVLGLSMLLMWHSGGLFNPTVGGQLVARGALPPTGGPMPLPFGQLGDFDMNGNRLRLKRPLALTFDGIAKGFAVDRAVAIVRRAGFTSGWVDAGGDMRAFGNSKLRVRRRETNGSITRLGELSGGAVATSVVAPQVDERFPGLTVSAGDNAPAPGAWTVCARYAWQADALTKVAALAGDADRAALLNRLHGALIAGPAVAGAA
ncbi:MAG: FAD:protein FMN transferase [Alphaproteobacteria bacterium]|nr:MAG: FAD:protein FMN transferase [Alphaproteobacteria bacterium]